MDKMKDLLKGWTKEILEGYAELGQKVYDEEKYKQVKQFHEEGMVTGVIEPDATREVIEPWLTEIAESVNNRYKLQMDMDDLVMHNMKRK